MTTTHKKALMTIAVLCIILILPMFVSAQPDNTPGDPDAPIDGGLSLLVAAGVGYGAKKLRNKKKQDAGREVETDR